MPSPHLSIRLHPGTLERLDKASRRAGTTRSALAKTLLEEGLRMEQHPGIVFRDGPAGRRAALARGPDIWQVMGAFEDFDTFSEEDIAWAAECLTVSTFDILRAIGYYRAYREEIDEWIRSNEEEFEAGYAEWLAQQPHIRR